ncbi:MAG TPA: TRASH domain-containing protein [Thermoanaerobaculia bacterium]
MPGLRISPRRLGLLALFCCAAILITGLAFAGDAGAKPALKKVEAKLVCMVNNQFMNKDQIPVQVEGKTYYGCCEMCKERLAKDAAARTGTDPVTGNKVDKAKAVIAAFPDGSVLYFESEETLKKFQASK